MIFHLPLLLRRCPLHVIQLLLLLLLLITLLLSELYRNYIVNDIVIIVIVINSAKLFNIISFMLFIYLLIYLQYNYRDEFVVRE